MTENNQNEWKHYGDEQIPYYYRSKHYKKQKKGYFFSGLLGAVLGALSIVLLVKFLTNTDNHNVHFNNSSISQNQRIEQIAYEVNTSVTEAVERVGDAVVAITNLQGGSFWTQAQESGTGSGVVYKRQGNTAYIVTNHHVIEGANQIEVTLSDGTKLDAELLGSDVWSDLAVLKVDGDAIKTVAPFGNSDVLKLGEPVIAIGNPLGLEFAGSITQGVVSGLDRTVPMDFNNDGFIDWNAEVLQTDAAINPGNSGGALVNIAGQVVGINSMKIARQEVEGIGFSIPVNSAIPVIEDIEQFGRVKRPYIGIALQELSDVSNYHQQNTLNLPLKVKAGILIASVEQGSPAEKIGLEQYDVIVKLDDQDVENIIEFRKYLYNEKHVGELMKIGYYRNGIYKETTIVLTESTR